MESSGSSAAVSGKFFVNTAAMPLTLGLAFVAFTTQFGGGFASGAQIYQYFINYGVWCLILPAFTQGLYALFFWYGMRYAHAHKAYDYRTFSDVFYGKYRSVFSNLFEICYLIMIGTASSAAFATGASTISTLMGWDYGICTVIIAAFIFLIVMFGTGMVRSAASTLSVLILAGLVAVLVPNILSGSGMIADSIAGMNAGALPVLAAPDARPDFGAALWMAFLYFLFQLPSVSVMYQHVAAVTDKKQIDKAGLWIFFCNFFAMELSILGLLAVSFRPELVGASVPMLVLVQNGVGGSILTPLISVLIILGAISTGTNMIAGIVARCVNAVERRLPEAKRDHGHLGRNAVFAVCFTFAAFAISQFGLMAIVRQGYKYLGYAGFITLFVPFVIHMIVTRGKDI
ncbi:MAG: hypothetical protein LIV11_00405 [Bacillota bacterium]|nr:hypothetical protein [Bacillota bacterium]